MNELVGAMVLTKTGSFLGSIADILGWIMDWLFKSTSIFGIENIGLCIILLTLVTKVFMISLTIKQQQPSKLMAVMQPEISVVQKKYKGKENDRKYAMIMQTETKGTHEKYGTSMTGGCLPLLIQMPIIFALYRVIYNISVYVQSVGGYYETIVSKPPSGYQTAQAPTDLVAAQKMSIDKYDYTDVNTVIDLLYKFTGRQWDTLVNSFSTVGQAITETGARMVDATENMQTFFGLSIVYTSLQVTMNYSNKVDGITLLTATVVLCIPLFAGLSQWYSTKLMTANQPRASGKNDNPAAGMMKSMNTTMPLMFAFFCSSFASGIGLYWVAQNVFTIIQQVGINSYLSKANIDDLVQKNIEKTNKKRAKKGLPLTKVGNVDTMPKKTEEREIKAESTQIAKITKTKAIVEESNKCYNDSTKPGSLTSKANMVIKYNEKHDKGKKQEGFCMDMITVTAKAVDDTVTEALTKFQTTSDKLEYEVADKGSTGFLGTGSKPATARTRKKETIGNGVMDFPSQIFEVMSMQVNITAAHNEEEQELSLNLEGDDMGTPIGKRGQTLDSPQYLVSLIVNKGTEGHLRVKLDTEDYRERRKETLEILAKNIAYKVKRTKRPASLGPMNPYKRGIIHVALQNDEHVITRGEGEKLFRHVMIALKKETSSGDRRGRYDKSRGGRHDRDRSDRSGGYKGDNNRRSYYSPNGSSEASDETAAGDEV